MNIIIKLGQNILDFVKERAPHSPILNELITLFRKKGKHGYISLNIKLSFFRKGKIFE